MDIRSNEARRIENAFIDGHMLVRQVLPEHQEPGAPAGSILINTRTNQLFGRTNFDRIYRLDANIGQMNLLAADGCSFDPVAFLPPGEVVSGTRTLSRRELLPARPALRRLGDSVVTPVTVTIACTAVSLFVGHGVHYFAPGLIGYAVNHWPFTRPQHITPLPHQDSAVVHEASPGLLSRLHPRPQFMSFHGEYAEDNAEQTNRAFADMGANEMNGGVGWSYTEAARDMRVQLPELTPLNIGIVGGVSLGATYGIYRVHSDDSHNELRAARH